MEIKQYFSTFFSIQGLQPVLQCLQRARKIFFPLPSTQIFPWQVPKYMILYTLLNPSAVKDYFHRISLMLLWSVFTAIAISSTGCFSFLLKILSNANDNKFSVPLLLLPKAFWSSSSERSHLWALEWKRVGSRQSTFSLDTENYPLLGL